MDAHRAAYHGFVEGSIAVSIMCFFVLVALVNFRFSHTLSVFSGFAGLIVGVIAVAIGLRAGGKWLPSLVILVLFGLLTAINIS
jgi:hypothetical protein